VLVYKFKTGSPDGYWCAYLPDEEPRIAFRLGRESLSNVWRPWHLDLEKSGGRRYSDFPSLTSGVITMSAKALNCYRSMLSDLPKTEILQCTSDDGDLYIINILNVIAGCFDRDRSVYTPRRGGDGFIRVAEKYEFHSDKLGGQHIFKFPEAMSAIFVSDEFVSIARDNDLLGLDLGDPIWSSG